MEDSLNWLEKNHLPDLIFMDIQLEDGTCFDIFEAMKIHTPVIFTTAYDQYALKAFKVNSVDYLLKPIDPIELKKAIDKYIQTQFAGNHFQQLESVFNHLVPKKKERFLVKSGQHFKSVPTSSINCFFIEERCNFLNCGDGKSFCVDNSLEKIGEMIDSEQFFRVNRSFIVNYSSITDVIAYSPGSLRVKIKGISDDTSVMVSRERISSFKAWMDR